MKFNLIRKTTITQSPNRKNVAFLNQTRVIVVVIVKVIAEDLKRKPQSPNYQIARMY